MSNIVSVSSTEDLAFAKALHGKDVKTGFLANLISKNKDVHGTATDDYLSHWKNPDADTEEDAAKRLGNYTRLTNTYYNLATDFYEYGWGTSFHFSRFYKGEEFFRSIARHEHYLAAQMQLGPNMRVLDVGCGVGGPAREIAHFSGAHITGFNNNDYQLSRAAVYAQREGLENQTVWTKGNFMEMPFEDATYDAVYAIEATVHAPKFEGVYSEIFRVLKPGGVFGCYEWCMTEKFDESDPEHHRIAHGIEIGNGIPKMRKTSVAIQALKNVGFEVVRSQDLADVGDEVKWYYPLEGDFRKAQSMRDIVTMSVMSGIGRWTTTQMCRVLEAVGLAPKGSVEVQKFLETAADALVEGGQKELFTPMFFFLARKPLA
ncbi:S-adenosyl-L-methionine-dependent methyltransferase [Jimgerdemannia flammicorona]|uniref:Sterol 24-C-methyltransferase n=1 Tax=Jimgerdemannia flammicorona TaxID=994334 RepID=A0A433DFR4_9FUNG|nr:S-adenosyl-L-methionine-dependent methyltransferase [Jimgerdemannia flammicorona]